MEIELIQNTAEGFAKTNPILEDWEMGKESDTNKTKFGDGITPWKDLAYMGVGGGGGVAVASSREEAEKMDIKDGEYVNIYKQDTRFTARSLVDVGMVSYDEMNCKITSLNGAKAFNAPVYFDGIIDYLGAKFCAKLVSAEDPTCRYEVRYDDNEGMLTDCYYNNSLQETIYDQGLFYHSKLYFYELLIPDNDSVKKITAENFKESEDRLRELDNRISLNGGEKGKFEQCFKRDGGIYPLVVNAVLDFSIPVHPSLSYFEVGEGIILVRNSTRLFPGQYLHIAGSPHLAKISDDMTVSFIYFEEEGAENFRRMFKTTLSLSSDKPVEDELFVEWSSYVQSLDPSLYEDSSSGDNTKISWQHVQTVLTSSQYSKHITVPDIRRNSRIEGASVFNTYDFIEFIDSVGASFWGIESPMQLNEDVTYWIEATCEKDETNGKYNISITYGNDLDPSGTWYSQQIAHDYPLARIAVPKASKIKPFRIYQELPNI